MVPRLGSASLPSAEHKGRLSAGCSSCDPGGRICLERAGSPFRPQSAVGDRADVKEPQPVQRTPVELDLVPPPQPLQPLDDAGDLLIAKPTGVEADGA